jgi:uncharacterized protein (TIRG00374 family)
VSKKWRLIGSGVVVALLIWRMRTEWDRVLKALQGLDGRYWLAAFLLYLATQVISTWRWQLFALALGLGGALRSYLSYYFVGMFFNLVLPTSVGGDVVRAWYLAHRPGTGTGRRMPAFLSVLADRVSGVVVLVMVACTAAVFCPVELPPRIKVCIAAIAAAAVVGVVGLPLLDRLLRTRRKLSPSLAHLARVTAGGMNYFRNSRLMVGTTALSVVVQVNSVIVMALIGMGLGLDVPSRYYGILMPLVTLLTLLPVSVGGIGVREYGTLLLLEPLGVGHAEAVTLAVLLFAVQTAAGLVGLIPYLVGGLQRFDARAAARENKEDEEPPSTAAA